MPADADMLMLPPGKKINSSCSFVALLLLCQNNANSVCHCPKIVYISPCTDRSGLEHCRDHFVFIFANVWFLCCCFFCPLDSNQTLGQCFNNWKMVCEEPFLHKTKTKSWHFSTTRTAMLISSTHFLVASFHVAGVRVWKPLLISNKCLAHNPTWRSKQ